ncbi:MAG TPA: prepilin-type N-terminal cleavage/methylation domain-containing protein [Rhodanobacteraceae bacterium]|nr:prepilin-type N-terminal cleavage/methylation domain-containing protein [Rhodanobacteraceae bacterium]
MRTRAHKPIARHRQAGFSLIEMVAAFLIFALGIGILMQILATSMHSTRTSSDYTMAALWAESKLDVIGVGEPIEAGSANGKFDDDYRWELNITQVDPAGIEPPPQNPVAPGMMQNSMQQQQPRITAGAGNAGALQVAPFDLYQIDLVVYWGGRYGSSQHSARFSTLRTMNPDPNTQQGVGAQTGLRTGAGGVKR